MKNKINEIMLESIDEYQIKNKIENQWLSPVIAFADAQDELFMDLKNYIVPGHLLPREILIDAKSVLVYFIPFHPDVVKSNLEDNYASKLWAQAYIKTNDLIDSINSTLQIKLKKFYINCALIPATHNFNTETLISQWSHRHVAYIAGLGKFGINHMLITQNGCAGRLCSLVMSLEIQASPKSNLEYCLFKKNGSCGTCISHCVTGALTYNRFDKQKCYQYCLENAKKHEALGFADVCGKCVVNIPCSFKIPGLP